MAENIREWFDEEIQWAKNELEKEKDERKESKDYFSGYKTAMETTKYKLLRQGII